MSASPEALQAIRTVAERLGDLRTQVVFVGGIVRGLLVTDPAIEGSRATKDVDVIVAGMAPTPASYAEISDRLRERGFREDTSEGAPICRWRVGKLIVDVMPADSAVLGFSNRWYPRAFEKAKDVTLADGGARPIGIRLVTAPYFLATKLEAFNGRGKGDYDASHDIEDIIALVDGRASLIDEVEEEPDDLRSYVATELSRHAAAGIHEAVPGHLGADAASQARAAFVICALERLRRLPRILRQGEAVESIKAGQPGANGPATMGPWRYEILGIERRRASATRDHLLVVARVTNIDRLAGTVGDGRDVRVEDARGLLFPPLYKLIVRELKARGLPGTYDQSVPGEPFETCWVYEVPQESRALRILLPFGEYELPIPDAG